MEEKKKEKKKYYVAGIIAALIIIGSIITVVLVNYYDKEGGVSLNYIEITQDNDFKIKYHFPGDGSITNPYIIENFNLHRYDGIAISITTTTKHFIIRNCTILGSETGIFLQNIGPDTATIMNITVINNNFGFKAISCLHLNITQSTFHNNNVGLYISDSNYASISEITCSNHTNAFWAESSNLGHFFKNTFLDSNEEAGIIFSDYWIIENNIDVSMILLTGNMHLYRNNVFYNNGSVIANCDYFSMVDNCFAGECNVIAIGELIHANIANNTIMNGGFDFGEYTSADIIPITFEDNFVNNKPVLFLVNQTEVIVENSTFGQIFSFNCTNVNVSNGNYSNTISAISCYECEKITITNNTISSIRVDNETSRGLFNFDCKETLIANNTITQSDYGLYNYFGTNHTIQENSLSHNSIGMKIEIFDKLVIQENNCTFNDEGIQIADLYDSGPNIILNNNCSYNAYAGIRLFSSAYFEIKNNTFTNNIYGLHLNGDDLNISLNAIHNNTDYGIYLYYAENCFVFENSLIDNGLGISLYRSTFNVIFHNNISSSNSYGIYMTTTANDNEVYLNNFINNSLLLTTNIQAIDDGTNNIFYDSVNSIGNYWSDWSSGEYLIDGSAGTTDMYPQSSPIIF
ncbi:MAG: right-handed parallel beta-helix repeat-containing protein [Candidatus Heimdallarchaeota archaeon]